MRRGRNRGGLREHSVWSCSKIVWHWRRKPREPQCLRHAWQDDQRECRHRRCRCDFATWRHDSNLYEFHTLLLSNIANLMSPNKQNNFGFLRLLLASLVVVSHSPEIVDGNKNREILTIIFGTITFGQLAIDCFFLISGYLILKSFYSSSGLKSYLLKRVLRIYPAFIAASFFCILIVAPLLSDWAVIRQLGMKDWLFAVFKMSILETPYVKGVQVISLNGSTWSIWQEFVCYLSIPAFFYLGLHKRWLYFIALLVIVSIYLYTQLTQRNYWLPYPSRLDMHHSTRLFSAFLVGGVFHLFEEKIIWNKRFTFAALLLLIVTLFSKNFAELGVFVFGGYLLFHFALNYKNKLLNNIGAEADISYGIYLYAWPIQILIVQYYAKINPHLLTLITLVLAATIGYFSWILVEKPFMQMKKRIV